MTAVRTLTRSLAGGEITPELYGRIDLTKFQTGLALCKNMMVLPHGPATCRPGFEYVLQCKTATDVRLIPFSFNTEQTYIVEVGNLYMRFHTNGQTVLMASQVVTSISAAVQAVLTYVGADTYANGNWVYVAGTSEALINGRYCVVSDVDTGANTFKLKDLRGNYIDTSGWAGAATGGTVAEVFELVTPYAAADLFTLNYVQSADVMTIVHPTYAARELSRLTASSFQLAAVTFAPTQAAPTTPAAVATVGTGSKNYQYKITSLSSEYEESVGSTETTNITNDLSTAGNYNTITWTVASGAVRYNVYKLANGLYGYIGQASGTSFVDDNIEADYSITPPETNDPFSGANLYPSATSYFEQRRVFGSTNTSPLGFWMTRSGTESNMSRSIPLRADDAITGRMIAREVNEVRHFVPLTELLVLTSGGEWVIAATDGGALSATNLRIRPQSYQGCSKIVPQVTGSSVLYVQESGKHVFSISYAWESSSYASLDVSIMAPHLVDDYTLVDMAYTRTPDQINWCARSDGTLLGMTYVPEHEVIGWHQHTTDGEFKSVAAVSENGRYTLYAVVARTIEGAAVQYLERMADRQFTDLEDWFGVDAGLTYSGAATSTITRLWHLEGEVVDVLSNGAVVQGLTVTGGAITLPEDATLAHIGMPYAPIVKPLPVTFQAEAGGIGRVKNINSLYIRVNKSAGMQAGRSLDRLRTYPPRTTEPYGSPPRMVSGEIQIEIDGPWGADGDMYITREGPLPLTITSISAEVEVGD